MRVLLFLLLISGNTQEKNLVMLRTLFLETYTKKESVLRFYHLMKETKEQAPVYLGYKGVSEIMLCKNICNPYNKWNHFNSGKLLLENALAQDPENVELHFLRYAIQTNAPKFLGYDTAIEKDKEVLISYVKMQECDSQVYGMILEYLLQSEYVSSSETALLKKYVSKK